MACSICRGRNGVAVYRYGINLCLGCAGVMHRADSTIVADDSRALHLRVVTGLARIFERAKERKP